VAQGADLVEIDVQETADGEVVVFHDSDFMRTAGLPLHIWDATLPQLRDIDIGSRFSPEYHNQRVPLLADVLSACRGRARVDIELKVYGHGDRLAERVAAIVDATDMGNSVVAMSLDHGSAAEMKHLRPAWPVGILAATAVGDLTRMDTDFLAVNASMVNRRFVQQAHRRGKQVYPWTINDPVQMSRLISLGVDGIITDHPDTARRVLLQRSKLSSVERLLLQAAYYLGVEPPAQDQ
jgi:glycerophosphoryl diester phosphodiesterase